MKKLTSFVVSFISILAAAHLASADVPPTLNSLTLQNQIILGANNVTASSFTVAQYAPIMQGIHDRVPYTALTAVSTIDNVIGVTLPANFKVMGITVTESTPMACGGACTNISSATISIGPTGNETAYFPPMNLFNSAGTYTDLGGSYSSSTTATTLTYQFINTTVGSPGNWGTGSVTNLTNGYFDISILGSIAP